MPTPDKRLSADEISADTLRYAAKMTQIGNRAVRRAQEENHRMGVPNVYHMNGQTLYELPDGTIATEDPWHGQKTPPADWPWRDRWEQNVAQKLEERRKRAAGLVGDE
jgi:hypothetical protein